PAPADEGSGPPPAAMVPAPPLRSPGLEGPRSPLRAPLAQRLDAVPERAPQWAARPVIAITGAGAGPVTGRPQPVSNGPSSVASRRPPSRPLAGTTWSDPL